MLQKGDNSSKQSGFTAPRMEFDQEKNAMKGTGGVLISNSGTQASADEGTYFTESKDVNLKGNVFFSWPEGDVIAAKAKANIDKQTGEFWQANFYFDETQYTLDADKLTKKSENEYELENGWFSACDCPEDKLGNKEHLH